MELHVKRMLVEKEDLDGKIKRVKALILTNPYGLSTNEKSLLQEQVGYMEQYREVLDKRIEISINK